MNGAVSKKALDAAMRAIPMIGEGVDYRQRIDDFRKGYMAGHAAVVRKISKAQNAKPRALRLAHPA